jgi:uncharacterized repeat protein (TIGR01451 family)
VGTPLGTDPATGNNSDTELTGVIARANLSITKTGPATVIAGQSITWLLTITNAGPSDAQTVSVSDGLPAGTSAPLYCMYVSPAVDCTPTLAYTNPTALATTLAAGATKYLKITATVNANVAKDRSSSTRPASRAQRSIRISPTMNLPGSTQRSTRGRS